MQGRSVPWPRLQRPLSVPWNGPKRLAWASHSQRMSTHQASPNLNVESRSSLFGPAVAWLAKLAAVSQRFVTGSLTEVTKARQCGSCPRPSPDLEVKSLHPAPTPCSQIARCNPQSLPSNSAQPCGASNSCYPFFAFGSGIWFCKLQHC